MYTKQTFKAHSNYASLLEPIQQISSKPIAIYLEIVHLLDNNEQNLKLSEDASKQLKKIENKFYNFKETYHNKFCEFPEKNQNLLQTEKLLLVVAHAEAQDPVQIKLYEEFSIKLHVLFPSFFSVLAYLDRHAQSKIKQPIHDICVFELPNKDATWNKPYWASLILIHGVAAHKYLPLASHVDRLLKENANKQSELALHDDLEFIDYLLKIFKYKRATENQLLATVCIENACPERYFNYALDFINSAPKTRDLLPKLRNYSLLEMLVRGNNIVLLERCINCLNENSIHYLNSMENNEKYRLIHIAVQHNSWLVFGYLCSRLYPNKPWDELMSLKNTEGLSVLFIAAKNNSLPCLELILHSIGKETLEKLLKEREKPNKKTILHYLAQNNAVGILQKIEEKILDKSYLIRLINKTADLQYMDMCFHENVVIASLFAKSQQFIEHLIANYELSSEKIVQSIKEIKSNDFRFSHLIHAIIKNSDVDLLKFLHQYHTNEAQWLESLLLQSNYKNALQAAMANYDYGCALYILYSLKSKHSVHQLFKKNLEELSRIEPTPDTSLFIRQLLVICSSHPEKTTIFVNNDFVLFQHVVRTRDPILFNDVLAFFYQDKLLFNRLINFNLYGWNILTMIISELIIPLEVQIQLIDLLFIYCSDDQLKILFTSNQFLRHCSAELLNYLLAKIDLIDKGEFSRVWASLNQQTANYRNPLICSFLNSYYDDKPTAIMLTYFEKYHSKKEISEYLLQEWEDVNKAIYNYRNLTILKIIFPLICHDDNKIKELYFDLYGKNIYCISLPVFEWLINQERFPASLLLESINVTKRRTMYNNNSFPLNNIDNLIIITILWQVSTKRFDTKQLRQIVDSNINDFYRIIVLEIRHKWLTDPLKKYLLQAVLALNEWIKISQKSKSTTLSNEVFKEACYYQVIEIIKITLLNCTPAERMRLIKNCERKTWQSLINEIKHYATSLYKLDCLLALKAEVIREQQIKPGLTLFKQNSLLEMTILENLKSIDDRQLIYGDEEENICIISANQIIKAWENIVFILEKNCLNPLYEKYHKLTHGPSDTMLTNSYS